MIAGLFEFLRWSTTCVQKKLLGLVGHLGLRGPRAVVVVEVEGFVEVFFFFVFFFLGDGSGEVLGESCPSSSSSPSLRVMTGGVSQGTLFASMFMRS